MRELGLERVSRRGKKRYPTTIPAAEAPAAPDLVRRQLILGCAEYGARLAPDQDTDANPSVLESAIDPPPQPDHGGRA